MVQMVHLVVCINDSQNLTYYQFCYQSNFVILFNSNSMKFLAGVFLGLAFFASMGQPKHSSKKKQKKAQTVKPQNVKQINPPTVSNPTPQNKPVVVQKLKTAEIKPAQNPKTLQTKPKGQKVEEKKKQGDQKDQKSQKDQKDQKKVIIVPLVQSVQPKLQQNDGQKSKKNLKTEQQIKSLNQKINNKILNPKINHLIIKKKKLDQVLVVDDSETSEESNSTQTLPNTHKQKASDTVLDDTWNDEPSTSPKPKP